MSSSLYPTPSISLLIDVPHFVLLFLLHIFPSFLPPSILPSFFLPSSVSHLNASSMYLKQQPDPNLSRTERLSSPHVLSPLSSLIPADVPADPCFLFLFFVPFIQFPISPLSDCVVSLSLSSQLFVLRHTHIVFLVHHSSTATPPPSSRIPPFF